jgi:hypothetical protein
VDNHAETRARIRAEVTADDPDIRARFLQRYGAQVDAFCDAMAEATLAWRAFDVDSDKNEKKAYVSALIYSAITLHIASMKLFLAGHPVAAGNLSRQVVEAIAIALLSSGRELNVLERFMQDKYSPGDAVRDVCRHSEKLNLLQEGVVPLVEAQKFYHLYSHPTKMTIASITSFSEDGYYVGASFDQGKVDKYDKEVAGRVSLAMVFPNFVDVVNANVAKW